MFSSDHISCVIEYDDNPSAVYYSGNTVNYRATITFEKPTEVKSIIMKIQGKAYVEWYMDKRTVIGVEKYYKTKSNVVGENIIMETGSYTYKSSEVLPINVPRSMRSDGIKGYIKHVVKIVVVCPLKSNKKFELPFTVLNSLDLNLRPELKLPKELEEMKTFGFGIFSSKKLLITGRVQKLGFVPGETINLYGEISNNSGVNVKYVNVALKKRENYTSLSNEHRSVITNLSKVRLNEISNQMSFSEKMFVPETLPTLENMSNVVEIVYYLQIRAKVSWNHLSPKLMIPLVIGTVPF